MYICLYVDPKCFTYFRGASMCVRMYVCVCIYTKVCLCMCLHAYIHDTRMIHTQHHPRRVLAALADMFPQVTVRSLVYELQPSLPPRLLQSTKLKLDRNVRRAWGLSHTCFCLHLQQMLQLQPFEFMALVSTVGRQAFMPLSLLVCGSP